VAVESGRIAVPRGWRNLDFLKPPVFRVGEGIGIVPPVPVGKLPSRSELYDEIFEPRAGATAEGDPGAP
jgi:hypothetical protein